MEKLLIQKSQYFTFYKSSSSRQEQFLKGILR